MERYGGFTDMERIIEATWAWLLAGLLAAAGCGRGASGPLAQNRLCELDLHCPAGTYCSAGVCDADCREDADCPSGQTCDARGRCAPAGFRAPPPRFAGHLASSATHLDLSPESPDGSFTLGDDGTEDIQRFHVLSDDPDVVATPQSGSIASGQSVEIDVTVHPTYGGHSTTIHVLSTGGRLDVPVTYWSSLIGRLTGTVTIQSPFALGTAPMAMELAAAAAGAGPSNGATRLSGAVDGSNSLLWPVDAPVKATDDGTHFTATFVLVGQPGRPVDPLFDVPIRRTVTLDGVHDTPVSVHGSYLESIEGLGTVALQTAGAFQLSRTVDATGVKPAPQAVFQAAAPRPFLACTPLAVCAANSNHAQCYFQAAFPFEQLTNVDQFSAGQCALPGGTGRCVEPNAVPCAFSAFESGPGADPAGELDVFRAAATYGLLQGNDAIAQVLGFGGADISTEIGLLSDAAGFLAAGLHGAPSSPVALLASAGFAAAQSMPPSTFQNPSTRDDPGNPSLDDTQRFAGAVAARLLAGAQLVDRELRSGGAAGAQADAQQFAGAALLDLAAVGDLLGIQIADGTADGGVADGGTVAEPVYGLSTSFANVAATFSDVVAGLNAVGYGPDYVPFSYEDSNPQDDVFQQAVAFAQGGAQPGAGSLPQAVAAQAALQSANLGSGGNANQVNTELAQLQAQAETALGQLGGSDCVPSSLAGCAHGGMIAVDMDVAKAAQAAYQAARDRASADGQKIQMLEQQEQALTAQQNAELLAVEENGKVVREVAAHQAETQIIDQGLACLASEMSDMDSMGMAIASAALGGGVGQGRGQLGYAADSVGACGPSLVADLSGFWNDPNSAARASTNQAEVLEIGQVQIQDDAMANAVFDANRDYDAALEAVTQQADLFDAATQKVENDWVQVRIEFDAYQSQIEAQRRNVAHDLAWRLYQNAAAFDYARKLRLARRDVFAVVRAYEYLENFSDTTYEGLVLETESAQDLAYDVNQMAEALSGYSGTDGRIQTRDDLISLRRDVLHIAGDVQDPVTGDTLTAAQQFQALLALPSHHDAAGNVQLQFATSILPGNGIFASDVAEDVLEGISASVDGSLIQSDRPVYLRLTQSGRSRLRGGDGTVSSYSLGPKTASVEGQVNAGSFPDPSLPLDTELANRPVDDAEWTLTFDQQDEPTNAAVDVSQIEDIELWIEHACRTIQQE